MWIYSLDDGELLKDSLHVAFGYSGFGSGKNNPKMANVANVGPIPEGIYDIDTPIDTLTHGPYVLPLSPHPANNMFGRSGFLIHGDSVIEPGTASRGCIILARQIREQMWKSKDHRLQVISINK